MSFTGNCDFNINIFVLFTIILPISYCILVLTIVLLLALFIAYSDSGEFTLFLHRLGFIYLGFYL